MSILPLVCCSGLSAVLELFQMSIPRNADTPISGNVNRAMAGPVRPSGIKRCQILDLIYTFCVSNMLFWLSRNA